jgi:histidine ammonia-lyase
VASILSIELLTAAQAIDLRARRPSRRSAKVVAAIRRLVPFRDADTPWGEALPKVATLVQTGVLAYEAGFPTRFLA